MLMRDAAIIHYALFFKKNNDSSCALFEGRLRNAGIYTTVFSGWKTQLHLLTVNPPYLSASKKLSPLQRRLHETIFGDDFVLKLVVTSNACLTTPQKICELFTGLRGRVPIVADKLYRVNAAYVKSISFFLQNYLFYN